MSYKAFAVLKEHVEIEMLKTMSYEEINALLNKQKEMIDELEKAERAAVEIRRLREWIRNEGERNNTCTFNVLGEVCGYCECKRKPSN